MAGVFITAFYSFRMLFLAFHGKERFATTATSTTRDAPTTHDASHDAGARAGRRTGTTAGRRKESPWVVTVPLILLAIPSVYAGWAYIEPMLFGDYFGDSIVVRPEHDVLAELRDASGTASARSCCTAC